MVDETVGEKKTNPTNQKLLIDIRELSELTGFSIGSLYHFVSQGRLPVVRLSSRCIRFRVSDIERWIAEMVTPVREQNE